MLPARLMQVKYLEKCRPKESPLATMQQKPQWPRVCRNWKPAKRNQLEKITLELTAHIRLPLVELQFGWHHNSKRVPFQRCGRPLCLASFGIEKPWIASVSGINWQIRAPKRVSNVAQKTCHVLTLDGKNCQVKLLWLSCFRPPWGPVSKLV